jgi:aspartyl-tRNA(Asn)/glutamyl-tRNA(Gln) amidotransferase subunit C
MQADKLDVNYVANLARLDLSSAEVAEFQGQLERVLEHVQQLDRLDLSEVEPTAHANPVFNVLAADAPREGLAKKDALANAPRQANGLFVITKVIES